jgi:hypothetical protein
MNSRVFSGMPPQAREIMELFLELDGAGTTIAQVTLSENNARHGNPVIRQCDDRGVT